MPKSHAVATVSMEITLRSTWGEDYTVGQVFKQGKDEAGDVLRNPVVFIDYLSHNLITVRSIKVESVSTGE